MLELAATCLIYCRGIVLIGYHDTQIACDLAVSLMIGFIGEIRSRPLKWRSYHFVEICILCDFDQELKIGVRPIC